MDDSERFTTALRVQSLPIPLVDVSVSDGQGRVVYRLEEDEENVVAQMKYATAIGSAFAGLHRTLPDRYRECEIIGLRENGSGAIRFHASEEWVDRGARLANPDLSESERQAILSSLYRTAEGGSVVPSAPS